MRMTLALAVILGWSAASVTAQEKTEEQPRVDEPALVIEKATEKQLAPTEERTDLTPAQLRDLAATVRINKALNEEAKIDVIEAPLTEVLQDIAKAHKISIVLDPEGCEVANVTGSELLTWNLKDISLRNALRTILKPMRLSFIVRNEVLTVTALDCPDKLATVRTFPLGRLTERMDDPSELISTLELVWPDDAERLGEERVCEPRARILANHLVVRGSPRHLDLAEQLIDGLMAERPQSEVRATYTLPPNIKTQVLPLPSKEKSFPERKPRSPRTEEPKLPAPPKASDPEAAQ